MRSKTIICLVLAGFLLSACPFLPSQVKKWIGIDKVNAEQFEAFNDWLEQRWGMI